MEKFTKIQNIEKTQAKKEKDVLFKNDWLEIKDKDGYVYLEEADNVCIIPYFIEKNIFYLRQEVIPSYKVKDNSDYHLTCISGTIEKEESPSEAIRRELMEEAGIVLKPSYKITVIDSVYKSKTCSSSFIYTLIPLNEYEYDIIPIKGDGSKLEKKSKTIAIDIKSINKLSPSDTITKLLLFELKKYANIFE